MHRTLAALVMLMLLIGNVPVARAADLVRMPMDGRSFRGDYRGICW